MTREQFDALQMMITAMIKYEIDPCTEYAVYCDKVTEAARKLFIDNAEEEKHAINCVARVGGNCTCGLS